MKTPTTQQNQNLFTITLPDGVFWVEASSVEEISYAFGIKKKFIKLGADKTSTRHFLKSGWLMESLTQMLSRISKREGYDTVELAAISAFFSIPEK